MQGPISDAIRKACLGVSDGLVRQQLASVKSAATPDAGPGAKGRASARDGTVAGEFGKTKPPKCRLAPRMMAAATLLVGGRSVAAAARTLGIGRRTLFRWLNQPAFRTEVDRQLAALSARVTCAAPAARAVPRSPLRPPSTRATPSLDDEKIDPQEMRRDLEFAASIAREARAKWHASARNGTQRRGPSPNMQNEATAPPGSAFRKG